MRYPLREANRQLIQYLGPNYQWQGLFLSNVAMGQVQELPGRFSRRQGSLVLEHFSHLAVVPVDGVSRVSEPQDFRRVVK